MRRELRTEMLRILEELSKGKVDGMALLFEENGRLTLEAIGLLVEHGALERAGGTLLRDYRITISGYDYYKKLKAPGVYWFKNNWFAVAVLAVTVLANVIVAVLD